MTLKTVGRFSLVRDADGSEHVTGPAEYMRSTQFDRLIRRIAAGDCPMAAEAVSRGWSPDMATAILVVIQTDFAAWHGAQSLPGEIVPT